jgi:hypothetical protein
MPKDLAIKYYSSFIFSNPKLETTQMSINRWLDIQIVVYTFNKILLGNTKEWIMDIYNNMSESKTNYAQCKKSNQKEYILYIIYLHKILKTCKQIYSDRKQMTEWQKYGCVEVWMRVEKMDL